MELIGYTTKDGTEQFVAACTTHGYFFNGRPPLVSGCADCWNVYYFCQVARSKNIPEAVYQLEVAIRHTAELDDKGLWDFEPNYSCKIENEKDS